MPQEKSSLGTRDLLDLLTKNRVEKVISHYAQATGVASGMVRWTEELAALPSKNIDDLEEDLGTKYEHLRLTKVCNACDFCATVRNRGGKGNTHCFYSDALYCCEAHERGNPVVYRCHAGLIDFVHPVLVGTYHEANVYGGQIVLVALDEQFGVREHPEQNLRNHPGLKPYVAEHYQDLGRCLPYVSREGSGADIPDLCSCFPELRKGDLSRLAASTISKTPEQLLSCIELLQDIADLLSTLATEEATSRVLRRVEERLSRIQTMEDGIQEYIDAARELISFECTMVVGRPREDPRWRPLRKTPNIDDSQARLLCQRLSSRAAGDFQAPEKLDREFGDILGGTGCSFVECIRMQVGGWGEGYWVAGFAGPKSVRERAARLLGTFAARMGSFMDSANEITVLNEVQHEIASAMTHPDTEQLVRAIVRGGKRLYGAAGPTGLWIMNHETSQLVHCDLEDDPQSGDIDPFNKSPPIPLRKEQAGEWTLSGEAIRDGRAAWEGDIAHSKRHYYPRIAREYDLKAVLSVPLFAGRRPVGVLNLHQKNDSPPTAPQVSLLEAYGRRAAYAVQTWDLYQISQTLDGCQCLEEIEASLQAHAHRLTGAPWGCVWAYREPPPRYVLAGVWGFNRDVIEAVPPRQRGGVTAQIRESGHPKLVCDVAVEGVCRVVGDLDEKVLDPDKKVKVKSWIAIPLFVGDPSNRTFAGALYLDYPEPKDPSSGAAELAYLWSYAGYLATAVDRVARAEELRCAEILAADDLKVAGLRYQILNHLATLSEKAEAIRRARLEELGGLADDILRRLQAILPGVPPSTELAIVPPLEDIRLRQLVEDEWRNAEHASGARLREPSYSHDEWWPRDPLRWPRAYLRRVIEAALLRTVGAIDRDVANRIIAIAELQIDINAYVWDEHVQLTVWCNCGEFTNDETEATMRPCFLTGSLARASGLRQARAILYRAGGSLGISNTFERGRITGSLVKLVIPKQWS